MSRPNRVTAPENSPVTLADVKAFCRIDHADEDGSIQGMIDSVVVGLDGYNGFLGRCIINQTWSQSFDCWLNEYSLPFPDCSEVVIKYLDENDVIQTLATDKYEASESVSQTILQAVSGFSGPNLSKSNNPITISFTAGYGVDKDAEKLPDDLKMAICMIVRAWYEDRGCADYPAGAISILQRHRVAGL